MRDIIFSMLALLLFLSGIWFTSLCERLRRIGK